jgi:hypothetical protein
VYTPACLCDSLVSRRNSTNRRRYGELPRLVRGRDCVVNGRRCQLLTPVGESVSLAITSPAAFSANNLAKAGATIPQTLKWTSGAKTGNRLDLQVAAQNERSTTRRAARLAALHDTRRRKVNDSYFTGGGTP